MGWTTLKTCLLLFLVGQVHGQCITKFCDAQQSNRSLNVIEQYLFHLTERTAMCHHHSEVNKSEIYRINYVSTYILYNYRLGLLWSDIHVELVCTVKNNIVTRSLKLQ